MTFTSQFAPLSFPNLGLVRFPDVKVAPEERVSLGVKRNASNTELLKHLAWTGYLAREAKGAFKGIPRERAVAQFKTEFATFEKTGVVDYLLLVWDIVRWAQREGIVTGWGRGSAGGSLTNYCLGIVKVNPLRHNLNFPRFLSEARMKPVIKDGVTYVDGKSAPDIDMDFQYGRRADVVRYIETKYAGHTCKISTRMELTGKMALKDALKVYAGYSEEEAKRVSDFIEARFGKVQSLHEAQEKNEDIQRWLKDPANVEVYAIALAIEGLAIAKGQHPSGVFISYEPLDGNMPVELSKTKETVTSFDMETVAGLGIKVDCLAVRSLDLVANTAAMVGEKMDDIDLDDPLIYTYLRERETYVGLFQIEEGTTKEATVKIKPRHLTDLSAVLAISRPGAMKYIDQFATYVRTGEIKPFYPTIDAILAETGGALIMQEQITAICREAFGLSDIDADQVRYAVGKKKREEMAKWEPSINEGGRKRSVPEGVIKAFWDVCNASADYQFCKAHSVEYACLTAATVYLKARHPQAFYLTMLKLASEEPNPIEYMNAVIAEMRAVGIQLLPPDLLKSEADFSIQDGHVRFGLSHIKGVSTATMGKIVTFKRDFDSKFAIFEAAKAAKINIAVVTSLIYAGCLDSIIMDDSSRAKLALEAQLYNLLTPNEKLLAKRYAGEYNEDLTALIKGIADKTNEKGKPLVKPSRMDTLRRDYEPAWRQYQDNSRAEDLCCYLFERHLLGYSPSTTLHACYSRKIADLVPLKDIARYAGTKEEFRCVAIIDEGKTHISAKGVPYYRAVVFDDEASTKIMLHGEERLDACKSRNGDLPKPGEIVTVVGQLSQDGKLVFADSVVVQPSVIRLKRTDNPEPEI